MSNKIFFKKIGYCFNDLKLFEEAITHRSYLQDIEKKGVAFNERMEFLGDAILDSIISELLYINLPEADEGRLTSRFCLKLYMIPPSQIGRAHV